MEIKVEGLTNENFGEFGSILNPYNCGESLTFSNKAILYYPDRIPISFSCGSLLSVGCLILKNRPLEIDFTENHSRCEEIIGGFTEDTIFHCGPPSRDPDFSKFKAFLLPKYHFSRLKRNVWHGAPFVINKTKTQGWVMLPPYTYTVDTKVITLKETIKIIK